MTHGPLDHAVEALKALAHPARLRIVAALRDGPLSVCQIGAVLGAVPSTVSGHLLDLRRAGLVSEHRQGKWVYYRLDPDAANKRLVRAVLTDVAVDPRLLHDQSSAFTLRARSAGTTCEAPHAP
jgi:ArsR family transcriptional regulator